MANRDEHDALGLLFGFLITARTSPAPTLGELIAGACGGLVGSRFADTVEPATHPGHRSLVHGIALNGAVAYHGARPLLDWRRRTTQPLVNQGGASRLASAFAVGAASGHLSHLLLDANTPRGLPWID